MSYKLYRSTTLGETLQDALDELVSTQQVTPELAVKVLQQYDQSMSAALATKNKTRYTFKGHLKVYRFCDNVWTCVLENAEIKEPQTSDTIHTKKLKIVACDASASKQSS